MNVSPPHAASSRGVLVCLSLCVLLSSLGTSIANVALPALAGAFGATLREVQWVVLAYLLGVTSLVVSAGRLGDLVGRRRLLLAGILLFTLAAGLCAAAPALWLLIAARALQGAGAAAMMALAMAAVKDALPADATGRAMGVLGTVSAVGTALGAPLGGVLIESFGWRAVFLAQAAPGIAALSLATRYLPIDGARLDGPRFDRPGTLLLALTLTAYALAMTVAGGFGGRRLALLLLAFGGAVLFVRTERRSAAPLVDLARFRDPALASGCAMSLLVTAVVMATLVVGPFYLSGALGLGAGRMGLAMAAGPVVAAIAGVPAGRAVDRVGAHAAMLAGLAGMELGAWLLWASPPSTVGGYAASLAVLTAGYALFQAANNTAVMAYAAPAQRGLVSGLLNLSRNLGLITGAAAMAALFMYGAGERGLAAGFRSCFGVAALLVGIAIVIAAGLALAGRSSYTRSGCHPIGVLARTASIALSVTHTQEEVMADDKDKAQSGNQKGQGSGQGSGHGSGHYGGGPGAGTSRESGFVPSSPEANVFPAGAAQTSHGSADGNPIPRGTQGAAGGQTDMTAAASGGNPDGAAPSAAGTPDEGRLGGSNGTSASGTTGNDPDR